MTDYLLYLLGVILLLLGFVGSVIPVIPGPPLAYLALWALHATQRIDIAYPFLAAALIATLAVMVADYVVPSLGVKKFGGGKWGVWGCFAGTLFGLFSFPIGLLFGPFVGAVLGERIGGKRGTDAVRAGFGAFLGFLCGTAIKVILCALFTASFVYLLIRSHA